jgi:hypothetical protein
MWTAAAILFAINAVSRQSKDAGTPGQFLQGREQRAKCRAVRLVHAVVQSRGEQVMAALNKSGKQQHRVLDVCNRTGARVLSWKHAAGCFRGECLLRHGEQ